MRKSFRYYCGFRLRQLYVAPQCRDPLQVHGNRGKLCLEAHAPLAPASSTVHSVETFHFSVLPLLRSELLVLCSKRPSGMRPELGRIPDDEVTNFTLLGCNADGAFSIAQRRRSSAFLAIFHSSSGSDISTFFAPTATTRIRRRVSITCKPATMTPPSAGLSTRTVIHPLDRVSSGTICLHTAQTIQ